MALGARSLLWVWLLSLVALFTSTSEVRSQDLDLGVGARSAEITTEIGPMKLSWARAIERCFESNPLRSVVNSAKAVSRALRNSRFSDEVRLSRRDWEIGFIDRALALKHFPLDPELGNHPGFMLPPNKIFILSDNITPDCSDRQIADDLLTQVLLHEMGHVIEYQLLGGRQTPMDRERSEGFAVWFEQYSSDFASELPKGQVRAYYRQLLQSVRVKKIEADGFVADPVGYAKAGLRIETVVSRKGITGLMSVYKLIREQGLPYNTAVEKALSWSPTAFSRHLAECCRD